jgi:hypothetical protein
MDIAVSKAVSAAMKPTKAAAVLLAMFAVAACDERLPTDPAVAVVLAVDEATLTGVWSGAMPISPPGEDWTSIVLTIPAGEMPRGEIVPRAGRAHPVRVQYVGGKAFLAVEDLPFDERIPCSQIGMSLDSVELRDGRPFAVTGRLSGRCPSTLMQRIRLSRS